MKKKLFEGYDFSDDANDVQSPVQSDLIVAKIKCNEILAKWRSVREKFFEEGKDDIAQELLLEDCVQKDSAEEIAMKLFRFVKPQCVLLEEEPEDIMNDDDIERMTTMQIMNSCVAGVGSIIINYYADIDSDLQSLENESRKKCIQGVAIKKHDRRWLISLEDDTDPFFVTTEDLMNDRKYYVVENNSENRLNGAGARKQSLKKRRQRLWEEMKSEQAAKKIADEKRLEWLKEEYHAIKSLFY